MKEKAIGKIIGGLLICLMLGLVFGGLIDTTSATTEKTTVSVTELSPWFTKGTNSGSGPWYPHTYEGHSYISTYVGGMSGNPSQPDCWAEFKPYLSQSGKYEVYAYFYACKDTSTKVPFTVKYDGGSTTIKVNQYRSSPAWKEKYLGTWDFAAGSSTYVKVTDATGETYNGVTGLSVGTIKFVKVQTTTVPSPPTLISPGSSSEPGQEIDTLTPTFNWNSVSNADYYGLYVSKYPYGSGNIVFEKEGIYGTSFTLPSGKLQDGVKYRWNMRAHNSAGWSGFSSKLYFTVNIPQPPSPPTLISPGSSSEPGQEINTLTPTFKWNSVSNADYYGLYVSKYPYGSSNIVFEKEGIYGTSFTIPSGKLQDGVKYRWNMRAHNSAGWSGFSSKLYFTVNIPQPPSPPTLISPGSSSEPGQEINTLTPTFKWNSVSNADYYGLYVSKYPYGSSNIVFEKEGIYGTSFTLPSGKLQDGVKYRWNMRAHNSAGWSDISNTLYFQTPEAAPDAPTITSPGSNSAHGPVIDDLTPTLQWDAVSGADYYALAIREDPPNGPIVYNPQQVYGTSHSVPSGKLKQGHEYRWNMQAHGSGGWSSVSNTRYFQTSESPPSAPTTTSPGTSSAPGPVIDDLTPTLQWNAVSGADYYALAIREDPPNGPIVYNPQQVYGTSHSVPSGKLKQGHEYRWNMQAHGSGGWSSVSNTRYFQTSEAPPNYANPPTHVSPSNGKTEVSLTPTFKWNSVSGADYYGFYISEPPYGENNLVYNGIVYGTSFNLPADKKLQHGVKYYWNMASHNSAGWSYDRTDGGKKYSDSWYFTTKSAQPTGSIIVTTNLDQSAFTINGPKTYQSSGKSWSTSDSPDGTYTITFGDVSGYITPSSETKILSAGGSITFGGTYIAVQPPTVETRDATDITETEATINGMITDDGGASIDERRFDWGTTSSCSDGHTNSITVSGNSFSYRLTGLQPGTKYYFRAGAKNSAGWGYGNILSFTTSQSSATVSSPPRNLRVNEVGDGYVKITWDPPSSDGGSSVTNYKIYRGTSSGAETLYYTTSTAGTTFNNCDNIVNGVTYYYKVKAVNAVGDSDFSNEVSATPTSGTSTSCFDGQICYSTKEEAVSHVPSHVVPGDCFVWNDGPSGYPWRVIPGTGCAHWVAHQLGIRRGATCYERYSIRVSDVIYGRTEVEINSCKVGDIWTNSDRTHCGIVRQLGNGEVFVEHDSSSQGDVITSWISSGKCWTGSSTPPTCAIELQKNGIPIDKVNAGQFFDIYVGDSSGSIAQVRFLIDENQIDIVDEGFTWTEWYNWDISLGDWDAETKIMRWSFHTEGSKEVWAEVKDGDGQTRNGFANIVTENLYWLAKAIMSEASVGTREERIAVGWTALNRLDSNEFPSTIKQVVESGYAYNQEPTQDIIDLSKDILERKYSDQTGGATYFFSPRSMTSGYGPYKIPGTNKKSHIPSWAIPRGYSKASPPPSDWEMTGFYKTIENLEWVSGLNNVRNWYFMFYRPISLPSVAKPVITTPLEITPIKDTYYVADNLNAKFTIKNIGDAPITFDKLLVGGRFNGGKLPNGEFPDFTFRSTTLQPNVPYHYTGTFTLIHSGNYHFFIAYYIENPTPEEKKLLDENNWNTCVDLGEGLTHTNRIKNTIVLEKELPPPGTVSESRDRINHNLQQQVKYPPYLPDPNSFPSAVATTWAKFTSWVTQTHLTERYDELYQTGIDYDCLSFKALKNARDSLDRGDTVSAEKYLQKSYTYEKLSAMSFGAAAEVFDDNLEAGEILAEGIKDGCEASVKFGLAITNPEAAKAADYLYIGVDYAVDRALVGEKPAAKKAIVKAGVTIIFNKIKFEDLGGRTIADYTENRIGKVTFPMLQKAFKNNEQIQFLASKIIKESGVKIGEKVAEDIATYSWNELEKAVNFEEIEVKSPVELRVYDSQGEVTGLINGEVEHGISRSVYDDGTVTILSLLDSYHYEVVGTSTGTYKLGITSIEDGEVINFTATDIPTSTNAIHQYTIDWVVLSQAEEGVTVKIDSDGDGVFEKTVTADNELSQEEYSTSTLPPLPPEPNQPPTLSDGYVTPASGDTSTIFNYYVTYKDPNGDAPIIKYVYIDGSSHTMTKIGGDYTSGARFKYSTKLSAGSHNYYFYFDDGHGHTVRLPTLGAYPGQTILTPTLPPSPSPSPKPTPSPSPSPKPNQPPTLSSGCVTPPSGDTSTIFNYYVTYKDPDGDAPAWHVVIKGAPPGLGGLSDHIMTKISGDYKSGAVFKYSTTLPALPVGYNYQYNFYFDDGHGHTVVYPDTEMFQGPTVVLPNQPPTLSNFSAGGQGQIGDFYITYTDPDGDAPTIKYVYIDGSPHTMTKISGDYVSGAKFKYSTTLSVVEEHNFYFYFEDGNGHSVRWPASETIVIPIPPPPPKP